MNDTRVRIEGSHYGEDRKCTLFHTRVPDMVATLAIQIVERWALVAAETDGEDSAGRQKVKLPPPAAVVKRAFALAELSFEEAAKRGHMVDVPDLNELNAENDKKREAKRIAKEATEQA